MHSYEESTKSKDKIHINELTPNSKNNDETRVETEDISPIKPIPINPKKRTNINNETPTFYSSSMTLTSINQDSEIPVIYPQFQLRCIRNVKNTNTIGFSNFAENNENLNKKNNFSYYDLQNSNYTNIKKEFLSNNYKNKGNNSKYNICCSCTKTRCIKKYCECFANNKLCKDCLCQNCMNNIYQFNNKEIQKTSIGAENVTCTCSKSGCNKKYCECYKTGMFCNNKCRCINCKNTQKLPNLNKDEIINLDEDKFSLRKNSLCSNNSNSEESFKVQRISVFINKNHTYINVEKFGTEDLNLLGKKTNMLEINK